VRKKASGKQKNPRRSDFEFPCLEPSVALHTRREEVEDVASYAHKLNREEKAWLNQFMKEYNEASVGSEEEPTGMFHVSKEDRKICTDRNNARNRCDYTLAAAANRLNLVESDYEMERLIHGNEEYEDDPELE
jgi:hypothetical protein